MQSIILVVHLLIALALVGVVLMQRYEGGLGGLGGSSGGGASGGMAGLIGNRASANLLTRATAILAAAFMLTSVTLAVLAGGSSEPRAIVTEQPAAPAAPADTQAPQRPVVPTNE